MNFGSLFSGIGGLDLGLERAGMECTWQVENDPYCVRVLEKHWPDVPRYGDIRELDPRDLGQVDLIAGGFPCQPVSHAGRQKAQADDRWLWPEFARILRELRPRYALLENVPGLLNANQGRAAQEVFGDLAKLGFDAEWASIPAAVVGAPHLRYRIFIVAYARCEPSRTRKESGAAIPPIGIETEILPPGCGAFERLNWTPEPDVGRVAHGVPSRVDRLRGLGNAVVPQVAEWVGRRITEHEDRL